MGFIALIVMLGIGTAIGFKLGQKKGHAEGKEAGFKESLARYQAIAGQAEDEGYGRGRLIGWLRAWEAVRDQRGVEAADDLLAEGKAPPEISKYPFRMYVKADAGYRTMHDGKKFLLTDEERAEGKKRGL